MTPVMDMDIKIEDTLFGDPDVQVIMKDDELDGSCRCVCYCKTQAAKTDDLYEMMASIDFGK